MSGAVFTTVEANSVPGEAGWVRPWRRFWRHRTAVGALLFVVVLVLIALLAPALAPYAHNAPDAIYLGPSAQHWLGTDSNGYDVLSRVMYGARLSLVAALVSLALAVAAGAPAGLIAGYCGGAVDSVLMRAVDVALTFPGILVAFLVAAAWGPSWTAVIVATALINVPLFARQVRATVLTVRELDYVLAARALGASPLYVLAWVIAPATLNPIVVLSTLGLGNAILEVAGFSFLGISGNVGQPEWGNMLYEAKNGLSLSLWPALGPGLAISLTVLAFNLLGDGLRDALDPRE